MAGRGNPHRRPQARARISPLAKAAGTSRPRPGVGTARPHKTLPGQGQSHPVKPVWAILRRRPRSETGNEAGRMMNEKGPVQVSRTWSNHFPAQFQDDHPSRCGGKLSPPRTSGPWKHGWAGSGLILHPACFIPPKSGPVAPGRTTLGIRQRQY